MVITENNKKNYVFENNWVRRVAGMKRVDNRRTEELMEEVAVKESFRRKLVRS